MFVLRNIKETDLEQVVALAATSDVGITHLPKNKELLEVHLHRAVRSFEANLWAPQNELYLFVMEDPGTGSIVGISGILSKTGVDYPEWYYHCDDLILPEKKVMNYPLTPQKILIPTFNSQGPSEIISLFLHPNYRKEGLGRLLSLGRFLFIASNRQRFEDVLIAIMRGVIEFDGSSPFWNGVGRNFLDVEFETVQSMIQEDPHIIPLLLPQYPIYTSLLRSSVQKVIGQTHKNTLPALHMLMNLNFVLTHEVDPFDAGPMISAFVDQIPLIAASRFMKISKIEKAIPMTKRGILCNSSLNFRAVYGQVKTDDNNDAIISKEAASLLNVDIGDIIRYAEI